MGSGVAKVVKERYPGAFKHYSSYVFCQEQGPWILGQICVCPVEKSKIIVHCFTQNIYGKDGKRYVSYDAVNSSFTLLADHLFNAHVNEVAMPKIGCGLGGGSWNIVEKIIEETLCAKGVNVKVYEL